MDHTLAEHYNYAFWYLDDVLIYADALETLRKRTRGIRRTLKHAGCEVNEKKSQYETTALLMAGLWIFSKGVGPNFEKLRELYALPPPSNKTQARSALGLVSYLRDFIPLTSMLTAKMHGKEITKDEYEQEWRRLIKHIQRAITTTRHFDELIDADLYTDSSGTAAAAVLIQRGAIIMVVSRKLTPPETRYSATDREHLSLALAAKKMKIFLHRHTAETRVWNDHTALLTRKTDMMTPRQARTKETIGTWIPTLRHVKGENNPADFFSRWNLGTVGGQIRL